MLTRKEENSQINNLRSLKKKPEKEEQSKPTTNRHSSNKLDREKRDSHITNIRNKTGYCYKPCRHQKENKGIL